jgi:hypothetical protein
MQTTVKPHILRRPLGGDEEAVATVPGSPGRALLVLRDKRAAESFGVRAELEEFETRAVSPEEIAETCARHALVLVALYEILEPGDLSVLSVEVISEIFEEAE